jgi:carbamoyltransferase
MSNKHTYVLGINAYDHDVSACLLRDGEIAFAISKERITGEKHDTGFYEKVVDYCLEAEGISMDDLDVVVRNCYILPVEDMEKRLLYDDYPELLDENERIQAKKNPLFCSKSDKVLTISHHLAHAYSAFAVSPFDEGVVMVVDGVGSYCSDVMEKYTETEKSEPLARESESYYIFNGSEIETLKKIWLKPTRGFLSDEFYIMPGLGALYSRVSNYIFADWNTCGEVMGLAPYGRSGQFRPLLEIKDGVLEIPDWTDELNKPWVPETDQDWEDSPSKQHWEDMAWQVQHDTEDVLLHRAKWLRETTGAKNLCIAGGVGLNCVANGRIVREAGFDNVWIQPAAGDDGIAIGCAYYGHLAVLKGQRSFVMKHANLGRKYTDDHALKFLDKGLIRLETKKTPSSNICRDTAELISEGHVFGWFQGGSEFGPRALGNRSILADPREAKMKDIINEQVKHRQPFRPFAPIVLAERAEEIFEDCVESPFMLLAMKVRPEWRDKIPAVVHVDGTARVQTVCQDNNERLYKLLKEFDAITGVPVLLNTSFNVKGEPIVEEPQDAVECFLSTGIDYLALQDVLIEKTLFHKIFSPVIGIFAEVKERVRDQEYA